jgi:hypothetical protein
MRRILLRGARSGLFDKLSDEAAALYAEYALLCRATTVELISMKNIVDYQQ